MDIGGGALDYLPWQLMRELHLAFTETYGKDRRDGLRSRDDIRHVSRRNIRALSSTSCVVDDPTAIFY